MLTRVSLQLQLLRVPDFLRFVPEEYDASTYEPTEADVANARDSYAYETIRWKRDPTTGARVSNALLYR